MHGTKLMDHGYEINNRHLINLKNNNLEKVLCSLRLTGFNGSL